MFVYIGSQRRAHYWLSTHPPCIWHMHSIANRDLLCLMRWRIWLRSTNGSAARVFCDMTLTCKVVGGGWMQVAELDMTNSSHQCPNGTTLRTDLLACHNKYLCESNINGGGCSSTTFDTHSIRYMGRLLPINMPANNITTRSNNIDSDYVDGISLTHGRYPRKHIWTFVCALDEVSINGPWKGHCPCTIIQLLLWYRQWNMMGLHILPRLFPMGWIWLWSE